MSIKYIHTYILDLGQPLGLRCMKKTRWDAKRSNLRGDNVFAIACLLQVEFSLVAFIRLHKSTQEVGFGIGSPSCK